MAARLLCLVMVLAVLPAAVPARAGAPAARSSGYTVSRTANGIQLTVHFDRRSYPLHALVAVTATLRNLSHRHLAVQRTSYPYGLCSWPVTSLVSLDASGQPAEPVPPIPRPAPPCPAPPQYLLPIGRSIVEHQLKVLWTPRLQITAQLSNFVHNCYCGFEFPGPPAQFRLYSAPTPTISVRHSAGMTVASISPPPGVRGPFYYQSWGTCAGNQMPPGTYYWKAQRDRVIPAVCGNPIQWHLDVAWLNMPVASINLGARKVTVAARALDRVVSTPVSTSRCPLSPTHGMGGPRWGWVGTNDVRARSAWSGRRATLDVAAVNSGYAQKVLWQMRRSFGRVVTLRGRNLRTGKPIRFQFADQGAGTQPVGPVAHLDPRYPNAMNPTGPDRNWLG